MLPPTPPECGVTAGMVSARIMIDYTAAGSIYHPALPTRAYLLTHTSRQRLRVSKAFPRIRARLAYPNGISDRLLKGGHDISVTQPTTFQGYLLRNPLLPPYPTFTRLRLRPWYIKPTNRLLLRLFIRLYPKSSIHIPRLLDVASLNSFHNVPYETPHQPQPKLCFTLTNLLIARYWYS